MKLKDLLLPPDQIPQDGHSPSVVAVIESFNRAQAQVPMVAIAIIGVLADGKVMRASTTDRALGGLVFGAECLKAHLIELANQ